MTPSSSQAGKKSYETAGEKCGFRKSGEVARICKIGAGENFSAAMSEQGELWVWGRNDYGQLGLGEEEGGVDGLTGRVLTPVFSMGCEAEAPGTGVRQPLRQAMGDMYSAERFPRLVRSLPSEGHRVVDFACGEHHVVALTSEGALFEWGDRSWLEPHRVSPPQVEDEDWPSRNSHSAEHLKRFC